MAEFDELDLVTLRPEVDQRSLSPGAQGTIVHVFTAPIRAYIVEFTDDDGRALIVDTFRGSELLPWTARSLTDTQDQ